MHRCHNPLSCFIPPHVLENLAASEDPLVRSVAQNYLQTILDALTVSAETRQLRQFFATGVLQQGAFLGFVGTPAVGAQGTKNRAVYDLRGRTFPRPGELPVRKEGDNDDTGDPAIDEAYASSGTTFDFYKEELGRNSIDDADMPLTSFVHYGRRVPNAFWNGEQMMYGDGDNIIFSRFTKALDVSGHELTHGVVQYTANLVYQDQPGALNEHFADVFGEIVQHWSNRNNASRPEFSDPWSLSKEEQETKGIWYMGGDIILPTVGVKGIRTFTEDRAYVNNRFLGTDPQPKHIANIYTGERDNGGVHINSGIPNHAFFVIARELKEPIWKKVAQIWYKTLNHPDLAAFKDDPEQQLKNVTFEFVANITLKVATADYGVTEQRAVRKGWQAVGITLP